MKAVSAPISERSDAGDDYAPCDTQQAVDATLDELFPDRPPPIVRPSRKLPKDYILD